jgi:hypothetical protein
MSGTCSTRTFFRYSITMCILNIYIYIDIVITSRKKQKVNSFVHNYTLVICVMSVFWFHRENKMRQKKTCDKRDWITAIIYGDDNLRHIYISLSDIQLTSTSFCYAKECDIAYSNSISKDGWINTDKIVTGFCILAVSWVRHLKTL